MQAERAIYLYMQMVPVNIQILLITQGTLMDAGYKLCGLKIAAMGISCKLQYL